MMILTIAKKKKRREGKKVSFFFVSLSLSSLFSRSKPQSPRIQVQVPQVEPLEGRPPHGPGPAEGERGRPGEQRGARDGGARGAPPRVAADDGIGKGARGASILAASKRHGVEEPGVEGPGPGEQREACEEQYRFFFVGFILGGGGEGKRRMLGVEVEVEGEKGIDIVDSIVSGSLPRISPSPSTYNFGSVFSLPRAGPLRRRSCREKHRK